MIQYSRQTLREMFDGKQVSPILPYMSLDADRETIELVVKGNGKISLSGVQPKYSMVVDNGTLRFSKEGEQGHYILKPAPTALFILDKEYCPANEYLTMQLAKNVYGIETAPCCLCVFGNGQMAYLVRRFDIRPDGTKYAQEDFAQLAGLSKANGGDDFKYNILSYEDCGELIRKHIKAAPVELLKFFRLVVFNYLTLNDDAHLKNFSIIEKKNGDFTLTPAPSIFALKKGLFKEGMIIDDIHAVNRQSFIEFGNRIGLPPKLVEKELDNLAEQKPLAERMIRESLLNEHMKRHYLQSYNYRRFTISK